MTWISGTIEFEKLSEEQTHFEGNILLKKINDIIFHGAIRESDEKTPVPGALVNVFARLNSGEEKIIGYSYSGDDGYYLLNIDRKRIPDSATAIIIRAGAESY